MELAAVNKDWKPGKLHPNLETGSASPELFLEKALRLFPEDLRRFADAERWTYAKTMPDWPHEYLVRERVDRELFERMVRHIRSNGYEGRFYQKKMTYYEEAGLVYWTMGAPLDETTIINRCRKEDSFEYRSANGSLPAPESPGS